MSLDRFQAQPIWEISAYAELEDFDEAVRWQRKAVHLASDQIKDDLAARLELYKQGKPYHERGGSAP